MAFENLKSTGIKYFLEKLKDYFLQIKDSIRSVNGNTPDDNGNIQLNVVPYAQNLESELSQRSYDTFISRTAGRDASIEDGDAWLMTVKGNNTHDGYTAESITMTVTSTADPEITATIDRDTFVSYVGSSGTTTLVYSSGWSADPADYGITVTGTPANGDSIVVVYVKEVRGTITVAQPHSFIATGWNLYSHSLGYARVLKYEHGYMIDGSYTALQYSATLTGAKGDITVTDGNFDVPADGYVWVTGGSSEDTAIWATWTDWTEGFSGEFSAYTQSEVDLSDLFEEGAPFEHGLMKAGTVVDEIDLNLSQAISRVDRMAYSAENLATAEASGREYEYDENYIYLAKATPDITSITIDGSFTACDHGIEYFTYTDVDVDAEILYGNNLKNKLERDVLTISEQELTSTQQEQVRENIGAPALADVGKTIFAVKNTFKNLSELQTFASGFSVGQAFCCMATSSGGDICTKLFRSTGQNGGLLFGFRASSANFYYSISNDTTFALGRCAVSTSTTAPDLISELNARQGRDNAFTTASGTTHVINVPTNSRHFIIACATGVTQNIEIFVYCSSNGAITTDEVNKGSNISYSTTTNKITFTLASSSSLMVRDINVYGGVITPGTT